MNKRGLIFFSILFVLVTSFVSAADYSCGTSAEIFAISSSTNAHGETNTGSYGTEICYDDYFGTAPSSPDRSCSTNSPILWLSGTTNAHASTTQSSSYNTGICYQGLTCSTLNGNQNCPAGSQEIVSLSGSTNAHLGIPGQYTSSSAKKICCSVGGGTGPVCGNGIVESGEVCEIGDTRSCTPSGGGQGTQTCNSQCTGWGTCQPSGGGTPSISVKQWRMNGASVTTASYGQTVQMYVDTSNVATGTTLTFTAKEEDLIFDDLLLTASNVTDSSGRAYYSFVINQAIINAASGSGDNYPFQFYFTVSGAGLTDSDQSIVLTVNDAPEEIPIANITAPVHRGIYFTGVPVFFNQSPGVLFPGDYEYEWTVENEAGAEETTSTQFSFTHTFPSAGEKTITLGVYDNGNLIDEAQIAVLAVNTQDDLFAFVNRPGHREVVPRSTSSNGLPQLKLDYSAEDSYVVDVSGSCPSLTLTCLAGNCPSESENWPSSCSAEIPVTTPNQGFSKFNSTWKFGDGQEVSSVGSLTGTKTYSVAGDKTIDLILRYPENGALLNLMVQRSFVMGQCIDGGRTVVIRNGITGREDERRNTLNVSGACNSLGYTCCPAGMSCRDDGNGQTLCLPGSGNNDEDITSCVQYTDQNDCNEDVLNIVTEDLLWGPSGCDDPNILCACAWDESLGTGGECTFAVEVLDGPNGGYYCEYDYTEGECVNGYTTLDITTTSDPLLCDLESQSVLCGRPVFELPFFNWVNAIVAGLAIFAIYFVYGRKLKVL